MLTIEFRKDGNYKEDSSIVISSKDMFNFEVDGSWLKDKIIRDIIKDVDKSDLQGNRVVSPILGDISVKDLSTGAKTLICAYNCPEYKYLTSKIGDNCYRWLLRIAEEKDITFIYSSHFVFPEDMEPYRVRILPMDKIVSTNLEFLLETMDFRQKYINS